MKHTTLPSLLFLIAALLTHASTTLALELPDALAVPGGVALIDLPASEAAPKAWFKNKRVMILENDPGFTAVVGLPLSLKPGSYHLQVQRASGETTDRRFEVVAKSYQTQRLTVKNKRMVNPEKRDLERIGREDVVSFG